MGKKPLLVWRSLTAVQGVINRGALWRVGDGKSIKVWGDNWVPTPTTFKIQSPCTTFPDYILVADLIDQDRKGWNVQLINTIFNEEEPKVIQNIPLSSLQPRDRLIWKVTTNEVFSVRSAYHMEVEWQEARRGETSNPKKGGGSMEGVLAIEGS